MSQASVLPTYTPTYRGTDNAAALEFERLAQLLNNQIVLVPVYNAAPAKAKTGMLAYADGVNWDPASLSGSDPYLVEYVGTSWSQVTAAGGGGVSDHGALTGLSDPDHPIAAVSGLQTALDAHTTNISANTTAIIGKNAVFWQATAPTATKIGDLWVDTDDNQSYVWSGSAWVSIRDSLMLQNEVDAAQAIIDAAAAQDVADGKIVTYYSTYDPTGSPDFATPGVGDLWFDTDSDNELWRWSGSAWVTVQDAGIAQAIADAATAQTTADGKIVTYIQVTAPVGGLGVGDIWFDSDDDNHVYRYSGSAWVSVRDQLILQNALDAAQAITDAADAAALADGKATTFVSASAPTAEGEGDLWFKTTDNSLWRWSGSAWVEYENTGIVTALSDAATAQATADGKIVTFRQTSAPTAEGIGDLWIDSDDGDKLYWWSGSSWVDVQDADIATAISTAAGAQATADGKVTTFYAASSPTAEGVGDLWVRTTDNRLYRWNGSSWAAVQDTDIAAAIANAATAQSTADGKIVTFYQTSAPTADGAGDLWIDSNDGDRLYRWNGSSWVDVQDGDIAAAIAAASTAQATADGKVTTFYAASAPTAEGVGDLWIRTSDERLYRWSGSAWVELQDTDIASAIADAATAQSTADGKIVTFYQTSAPTAEGVGDMWFDTDDSDRPYRWSGSSWVDISWITGITGGKVTDSSIDSGTFAGTWFGFTTAPTGNINYIDFGNFVIIYFPQQFSGASNNTSFTCSGLPAAIRPSTTVQYVGGVICIDNGVTVPAFVTVSTGGVISFSRYVVSGSSVIGGSWTGGSVTKGVRAGASFIYPKT